MFQGRLSKLISKDTTTEVTSLFYLMRELHCVPDLIGRNYEIYDKDGILVYTIRQKPMNFAQINILLEELKNHYKREEMEYKRAKNKIRKK